MEIVEHALRKVKKVLRFTSFLYNFINTFLVFLLSAVFFVFFSWPLAYALLPAGGFFIYASYKKNKKLGFGDVEKKIPELEWRLRTSADNKYRHDELASSLHKDVMNKIKLVKVSKFLGRKNILYKFATAVFLLVLLAVVQVNEVTYAAIKPSLTGDSVTGFFEQELDLSTFFGEKETDEDLYGESSVAPYGDKEELLKLSQAGGLVDNNANGDGNGKDFTKQSTGSGNEEVISGQTSKENLDPKNKKIVTNYFTRLQERKE